LNKAKGLHSKSFPIFDGKWGFLFRPYVTIKG
jgi:hypothetical protein